MPLDFSFRDVENWREVCRDKDGRVNGITEALIWLTMTIGISDITHKITKSSIEDYLNMIYVATAPRSDKGNW